MPSAISLKYLLNILATDSESVIIELFSLNIIDLRTAQVYWHAIFVVSQEVYLNFHHFCG